MSDSQILHIALLIMCWVLVGIVYLLDQLLKRMDCIHSAVWQTREVQETVCGGITASLDNGEAILDHLEKITDPLISAEGSKTREWIDQPETHQISSMTISDAVIVQPGTDQVINGVRIVAPEETTSTSGEIEDKRKAKQRRTKKLVSVDSTPHVDDKKYWGDKA